MRPRLFSVLALILAVVFTSRSAAAGGPLSSGSTVAGSVAGPTFLEQWTFTGTAGQRIIVVAVTTNGLLNTDIVLKAPGGSTEASSPAGDVSHADAGCSRKSSKSSRDSAPRHRAATAQGRNP
jgi:hypothetical protein